MMQIGAVLIYAPSPQVIRSSRWTCTALLVEPENVLSRHATGARINKVQTLRGFAFCGYKLACVFAARFG